MTDRMPPDVRAKIRAHLRLVDRDEVPAAPQPVEQFVIPIGALILRPEDVRDPEVWRLAQATVDTWVACAGKMTREDLRAGLEGIAPELREQYDWIINHAPAETREPAVWNERERRSVMHNLTCLRVMAARRDMVRLQEHLAEAPDDEDARALHDVRAIFCRDAEKLFPGVGQRAVMAMAREETLPPRAPLPVSDEWF